MNNNEDIERLVRETLERCGDGFSIGKLAKVIAERRNRPIELIPWPMPDVMQYGVWLSGPRSDYIFFEKETASVHQSHIILHELSHILLGHQTVHVQEKVIPTDRVLMRRMRCESRDEKEAEELATAIQRMIIEHDGMSVLTSRVSTAPVWSDLVHGLGYD